jgi:hypothetical protein
MHGKENNKQPIERVENHVPLTLLWKYAKRRGRLSQKETRHVIDCGECAQTAVLCEVHSSMAKVRAALTW